MTEMDNKTKEKIGNLQMLDQKLQSLLMRKQVLQTQLLENENTLAEIKNDAKEVYKIVGGIMISVKPLDLKKELESSKELAESRVKNLEKEEIRLKKDLTELQEEVMKMMKK